MPRLRLRALTPAALVLTGLCLFLDVQAEENLATARWVQSTAYVVPKETATEGEG